MDENVEILAFLGVASAVCMLMIIIGSFILNFFVALRARPKKRAAWTVGIAFAIVAVLATLNAADMHAWVWPVGSFVGAVPVYFYYLHQYNYAWVESIDDLPEGVSPAEDDWRSGLIYMIIFFGSAALLVFVKTLLKMATE